MQNERGPESKRAASGANVQSVGNATQTAPACDAVEVAVGCDRCPSELRYVVGDAASVERARGSLRQWSYVSVARVVDMPHAKVLTLCAECARALRLFLLGAGDSRDVGERWESVMSGAV